MKLDDISSSTTNFILSIAQHLNRLEVSVTPTTSCFFPRQWQTIHTSVSLSMCHSQCSLCCNSQHTFTSCQILRFPADPRLIPYCSLISFWPFPKTSNSTPSSSETPNSISLFPGTSNQSPRPLTPFQFLLFHFSSLALHFQFHIPVSVSSFPFPIYYTVSVFLHSLSSFHSTIKH